MQGKKDFQPWCSGGPFNKPIPKCSSPVLLTLSHPSSDPQQHPQGDLPPAPPHVELVAAMDQRGGGAARSPRGGAEGGSALFGSPRRQRGPAAVLPFRKRRRGRELTHGHAGTYPASCTPRCSASLASSTARWSKPPLSWGCPGTEPRLPGAAGPHRTARREKAQCLFQKDINRKRCLTSSNTSSLLFPL